MAKDLLDAAGGALLGTFVGDAMGMPVEGWSRQQIVSEHGILRGFVEGRLPAGTYTDDTEMALAMAVSLVECGGFDPEDMARRFAEHFTLWRGYTPRICGVVSKLRSGAAWNSVAGPSWGNGGAMRIAPLGVAMCGSADLIQAAEESCKITHTHPNGVAGAVVQALGVSEAVRRGLLSLGLDRVELAELWVSAASEYGEGMVRALRRLADLRAGPDPEDKAQTLSTVFPCDVSAAGAVPAALAAFLWSEDFEDAVVTAVNAGGDSDTVGAMAGALAGAYYGASQIPEDLLAGLSEDGMAPSEVKELGRRLGELARTGSAGSFELSGDEEEE